MDAARLSADAARITTFSGRADAYRWPEERDGHAVGQQQAERHRASAGWRDALWRMGSCHLPASAGRGVWVPEGGVCGPRDPSSESSARRLRRIDFADRPTPRFTNCPHSKARCNQKEGQMSKVRLYGTFTEVRAGAKANSDRGGLNVSSGLRLSQGAIGRAAGRGAWLNFGQITERQITGGDGDA